MLLAEAVLRNDMLLLDSTPVRLEGIVVLEFELSASVPHMQHFLVDMSKFV